MTTVTIFIIMICASYLLGAIPWGLIIGNLIANKDIRGHGSGNIGATNVLRTIGWAPAILVLLLDTGKGIAPIFVSRFIIELLSITGETGVLLEMAAALSVIIGHSWSVFLRFNGGRGIATGLGSIAIFSPWLTLGVLLVGLPIMAVSRMVSLGSTIGALLTGIGLLILGLVGYHPIAYAIYGVVASGIVLFRHKDNIFRIIRNTESRIGSNNGNEHQ